MSGVPIPEYNFIVTMEQVCEGPSLLQPLLACAAEVARIRGWNRVWWRRDDYTRTYVLEGAP